MQRATRSAWCDFKNVNIGESGCGRGTKIVCKGNPFPSHTPALCVTQQRRCSCGMRLVALYKYYVPLPDRSGDVACSVTTGKTWLRFTRENLCRAQGERHRSAVVRAQCEQLMRRESMELWKQIQLASRMISIRVANTNDAVQKLRQHVERVSVTWVYIRG